MAVVPVEVSVRVRDTGGEVRMRVNESIRPGSGRVSDYEDLSNKPSIEDVVLMGNKSFSDLGLEALTNEEIEVLLR